MDSVAFSIPPAEQFADLDESDLRRLLVGIEAVQAELLLRQRLLRERLAGTPASAPASRRRWLRVKDVAQEYGVSAATVYGWVYKRQLPTKKLGESKRAPILLARADVERLATVRQALRSPLTPQ